tara:strand:- start:40842 stop:41105 length:264 start_codon:yes stop_codon:yes gene_type:complete
MLLFGGGLVWARYRDRRLQHEKDRHQQVLAILQRIESWSGSEESAWAWYRTYPIAALGGRAAQQLVHEGRAGDVLAYLSSIDRGGYA